MTYLLCNIFTVRKMQNSRHHPQNQIIIADALLGPLLVCWSQQGIASVQFLTSQQNKSSLTGTPPKYVQNLKTWLKNYGLGLQNLPFPRKNLDLCSGTPFQKRVWAVLSKIPYGKTRSYKWIAEQLGYMGGCQAIGQANKRNPFPIVIPCHRVIAADGSLGGYAAGITMKKKLLKIEGIELC